MKAAQPVSLLMLCSRCCHKAKTLLEALSAEEGVSCEGTKRQSRREARSRTWDDDVLLPYEVFADAVAALTLALPLRRVTGAAPS